MFIGHFGIGLGAKRVAPKVSLGMLFLAAQFLDLLWPTFLLLGWERVEIEAGITKMAPLDFTYYPWSHSLLMAIFWGFVVGGSYYLYKKRRSGALIIGICVVSHWLLDLLVHTTDLPLFPGGKYYVGLGLWNHVAVEILLESAIFIGGLVLYLNTTEATNRVGKYSFWALVIFLAGIHMANTLGPPPPNLAAIAWAGQLQWLFVIWAFWVDKNRRLKIHNT
ncbi:MAG: hypothetical protein KDC80_03515 [Saprospiraceae bacterium]|nr:hypothetical protein [Saprospiraceae bacterium]